MQRVLHTPTGEEKSPFVSHYLIGIASRSSLMKEKNPVRALKKAMKDRDLRPATPEEMMSDLEKNDHPGYAVVSLDGRGPYFTRRMIAGDPHLAVETIYLLESEINAHHQWFAVRPLNS